MADDRLDVLKKAREQMAEARFAFAEKLAGPYERGETERWKEQLLETQAVPDNRTGPRVMHGLSARADVKRSQGRAQARY